MLLMVVVVLVVVVVVLMLVLMLVPVLVLLLVVVVVAVVATWLSFKIRSCGRQHFQPLPQHNGAACSLSVFCLRILECTTGCIYIG